MRAAVTDPKPAWQSYLEIRDRLGRELVTVIELLSPSNKRAGADREAYLAKRRELLRSTAHLVEIDLLRGRSPMPSEDRPECDYSVMVSRAEKRRAADFWPIMLRDRLPVIPIPLRPPDDAVPVDLQEVLHRAYDGAGYERFIYGGSPEPGLSADDAAWAREFVPAGAPTDPRRSGEIGCRRFRMIDQPGGGMAAGCRPRTSPPSTAEPSRDERSVPCSLRRRDPPAARAGTGRGDAGRCTGPGGSAIAPAGPVHREKAKDKV